MFAVLPALLLAAAPITVDRENHSVTLSVTSTDCGVDTQLEFLMVGPGSDRDYEAMFVTDASPQDIARAFVSAGIGNLGSCYDPAKCVFWPTGQEVTMEPAFTNLVRQTRNETLPSILWTGGARDPKTRIPQATTNMPGAVFALYNCGQSLLQFNDSLDQSLTYGRFQPAVKIPKGEKRTITFKQKDVPLCREIHSHFKPGYDLSETLTWFKEQSAKYELELRLSFAPELSLRDAVGIATAMSMIDSVRVKVNGHAEGQFYYRAYLPLEKWRDRKERLSQPPEVHLKGDGTATVVETIEDWNNAEDLDPKLIVKEHACADIARAAELASALGDKTSTVFIYAAPETKLARLYELRKLIKADIRNWYVFTE